jgi:protein-S-isoprenylcysteine O-methyltransferase Ste14
MVAESKAVAPSRARLLRIVLSRFVPGFAILCVVIFLPAGDLSWANGWLFLGSLAVLMLVALAWLLARDPALLERRMRTRERERPQKLVILVSLALIPGIFVLPGLDRRFGWSSVPDWVVAIGMILVIAGYVLFYLVLRANSWASRVIEVQEGQRVIDSGPYAVVRHPMYLAVITIYLAAPLVLGSWWALIPAAAFPPILAIRAMSEEKILVEGLPGYDEYRKKVRWRILPGIW